MGIFRRIFIVLDAGIYGILEQIFQLIINLANFDLFDGNVLKEFSTRIYLILGLVMVFKLMISFIQILIEPDKMSDKEKGVGSLLRRVVISLVLIVLVPSIFSTAKKLQNYIIPIIPKVVVGVEADVDSSNVDSNATYTAGNTLDEEGNVMMSTGRLLAYYSFLPFFYYDNDQCNDGSLYGTTSDASLATIHSVGEAVGPVNNKCENSTNPDRYRYNYRLLTSTIVGAYLVYVLVTVALQIAIRTIKFGLCQVLAPIPIASYIDPKTSKQSFDKWVQTSIKVYLDLFTRLIVVYFVIFIFRLLFDQSDQLVVGEVTSRLSLIMGKYGAFQGLLLILFIITGLLQFARQMPKFVSDLLGVPDGFSDIGDMFRGTGFRALRDTVQLATNPITIAGANAINTWRQNGNQPLVERLRRAAGSAIAGGVSTATHSTIGVLSGQDPGEAARRGREHAITARRHRATDRADGVHWYDRARVGMQDYFGIDNDVSALQPQVEATNKVSSALSGFTSAVSGRMDKHENLSFRSGESAVLDSIARAIERNGGPVDLAHSDNIAAQRLASLFRVGADGHIETNARGHVEFAAGHGITNRELQEYAEALQGTALGGFFESNGLKQDVVREIRNNVAAHEAVELQRDIQGNVTDTVLSGLNNHRDIEAARNAVYQAQRENVSNLVDVDTNRIDPLTGQHIIINGNEAHQNEFNANFSDYSDMIQDHRNALQNNINSNERNVRDEAARRSQGRRQQNNNQNGH